MKHLVLLLAVLLPACVNQETVDAAFCDEDEACFGIVEPEPVVCGGVECVPNKCYSAYECASDGPNGTYCHPTQLDPSYKKPSDACTDISCDPETGWKLTPVPIDDGDACTIDRCDLVSGDVGHDPKGITDNDVCTSDVCDPTTGAVTHEPIPGCVN